MISYFLSATSQQPLLCSTEPKYGKLAYTGSFAFIRNSVHFGECHADETRLRGEVSRKSECPHAAAVSVQV